MKKNTLTTLLVLFIIGVTNAQVWKDTSKFEALVAKENDKYGVSVGINSNYYFIGASLDDEAVVGTSDESKSNGGAVYVYNSTNKLHQKLFPSEPMKSAYFGNSLAVNDNYLVVGSYYGKHDKNESKKEGLAYIFNKNASNEWVETKILKQEIGNSYDLFGRDVAVNGDYILVSANGDDEGGRDTGAAYIFFKNQGGDNNWGQQAKLKVSKPQSKEYLGWSGDLYGDYAVLGAYKYDANTKEDVGTAYVFKREGTTWRQQKQFLIDEANPDDLVGYDVAIYENRIAISAPNASVEGVSRAGKVYVFEKGNKDSWNLVKTLVSPSPVQDEIFGHKIAMEGDKIVVSSKGYNSRKGRVFVFTNKGTLWTSKEISKQTQREDDNYGASVALKNDKILIGSDEGTDRVGAVYAYNLVNRFNLVSEASIPAFYYASLDWGDFDNDGYKDLVISGGLDNNLDFSADVSAIKLYRNKQNGQFEEVISPEVYGLHLGAVKFADIDNDGDLDLVTSGQNYNDITKYYLTVYENKSGAFTKKQELDGVIYSSISFGDFDNNGTLDLLVTGAQQSHGGASKITKIYKNTNGSFVDASINLPAVQNGNAEFADIDVDGDLDILLMGTDKNDNYILKTFENVNGVYTEKQNLPGMYLGWFAFGDFNADGYLDFAVMGDDTNDDYAAKIYKNVKGEFAEYQTLKGIDNSSGTTPISWGDYDNDGELDLVISGTDVDYNDVTIVYKNTKGKFEISEEGVMQLGGNTSLGWGDFDLDNDIDIIVSGWYTDAKDKQYKSGTFLHENLTGEKNNKPLMASDLVTTKNGNEILFEWNMATDDFTKSKSLYYILNVGTQKDKSDIASYPVYGTSWKLKYLEADKTYFWNLQTVDASQAMSDKIYGSDVVLSVNDEDVLGNDIVIYPNPTAEKITIKSSVVAIEEIKLLDVNGKVLSFNETVNARLALNIAQYASGVYILSIKTNKGFINRKIIKN
ncbi:FG-GAP-like repeat-containing protein [Tenacibaculum sp. 190524A02b]|uniref:FG-GAP-like repeat-containing protein n=1 Tax=Tenacibaculum vairaonense TaxID=3137860 RepID=UPI0031FB5B5C